MPARIPDVSERMRIKKIQLQQQVDKTIDPLKIRIPLTYGFYQPTYNQNIVRDGLTPVRLLPSSSVSFYTGDFTLMGDLSNQDDEYQELDMTGLPFYFNGTNYGDGESGGMFMSSNNVITFGKGNAAYDIANWAEDESDTNAVFINARDRNSYQIRESPVITSGTLKYKVIDQQWADHSTYRGLPVAFSQIRLITDSTTNNQYIEYRLQKTDKTRPYNLFGTYFAGDSELNEFQSQIPTENTIYLFTSNSTGTTWSFGTSNGLPY